MSPMVTSFDFATTGAASLRAGGGALPNAASLLLTLLLISP